MTIDMSLSPSQKQLRNMVHMVARDMVRPISLQMDRDKRAPDQLLRLLKQQGAAMGGGKPKVMGGDGADDGDRSKEPSQVNRTTMIVSEEMAWGDASLLLNLAGTGLGGPPVASHGTADQKKRFFGIFEDESELRWGAYGLTEPGAGSDVSGIRTSCRKDGDEWVLNGRKCYITNGAKASWVVIFATVNPSLGRAGHRAFVVERGTPGFSVGKIEDKLGLRASETAELVLEDCRVPADNLLGGEQRYERGKEGFVAAMKTFDNTRPIVGAMALGIGRAAHEHARDFVKDNYMLSRPVPRYRVIADRIARTRRSLDAARLLCWRAAWMADLKMPNSREASMAKAAAGQAAVGACVEALDIVGAHAAFEDGEHALLCKWFRDIKVFDIFEGTGQIQRVVIAKRLYEGLRGF
jgi:acyl-CoA dehydrogenase